MKDPLADLRIKPDHGTLEPGKSHGRGGRGPEKRGEQGVMGVVTQNLCYHKTCSASFPCLLEARHNASSPHPSYRATHTDPL